MHIDSMARPRRRLSLTSLIDVIFLLLLFFMLSSTFSKYGEFEVTPGSAGGVVAAATKPSFLVSLNGDDWRLNGKPTDLESLAYQLRAMMSDEKNHAIVVARASTTSQQLVSVLETLRKVEGLRVTVSR